MANIFRYASVVAQPASAVPSEASSKNSKPCTRCNYSNNYYGDQVCVAESR